jgi:hypothetical protein
VSRLVSRTLDFLTSEPLRIRSTLRLVLIVLIALLVENTHVEHRNEAVFKAVLASYAIGSVLWLIFILIRPSRPWYPWVSTFADVAAFHKEAGVVGNNAPGLLGDNPRIAYNDVPTIIARLPLAQACTHAQLKTVVAFKEGISQARPDVQACADYIVGGLRRLHCRRLAGRLGHGEALARPGTCASRA